MKAPITLRSTTATPNPPPRQPWPQQTRLDSRLSIKAGDPKPVLLLLHGAIANRGPPPATVARAHLNQRCRGPNFLLFSSVLDQTLCCFPLFRSDLDQIWCCSSTRSSHLLPFAATSSYLSSGSTVAHLLPPTTADPASVAASKPRGHRLFLSQTTAKCRTLRH
ncbi:hypothetical protein B296_00053757 [Ensete ventricosum]|uniref:Uncharacterized protein n=1 Tax=Ensete ventricosum TaxID=4639 RepID=A0A426X1D9_ENSVE|nr:hypothetical protein B296_00053757 [Ensete ventricosum]